MKLYATKDVEGTLGSLPDPRLAPTAFGATADARAATVGAKLDALLLQLGLSPFGAATAQAQATVTAATPATTVPLLQRPVVLFGLGALAVYLLTKGR